MKSPKHGHIVIAPDKFKGSLTAAQAAEHLATGLRRAGPGVPLVSLPIADGGDGTVETTVNCGFARRQAVVSGPTGLPVVASYAVRGASAVIELAQASGLSRLPRGAPAPLTASSFGTGELIAAALRGGARRIVLGLGGSACTDGGTGMATALGARFLDARGVPLPPGGAALRRLSTIELNGLADRLAGTQFIVAGDVDSPLLGPAGAAEVFGAQKGATPAQRQILEAGLTRLAEVARRQLGGYVAKRPGAGAAGGSGYGAMVFLEATLRPGITHLLDLLGFAGHLAEARLVITGEGTLDQQTLRGKAPAGVALAAAKRGVPVVAVAGRRALTDHQLRRAGFQRVYTLTDLEPDHDRCMAGAGALLERLAGQILRDHPGH